MTRLSRSNDADEQNQAKLATDLKLSLKGYPPEVQDFEQNVNALQAQINTLPRAEHQAYAGALATLDVAFRDSKDANGRQHADEQLSKLGDAVLERATVAENDSVERALSVFNRPVGAGYLTGLGDRQQLSALPRLREGFVNAATPAARERYFTLAAELKNNLQHKVGTAIDQHTTQEAGKWAAANAEVNRIIHEADALTNAPGKRYELIGRQLYSTNPGTGRDDLADRRLLAFTQRMRDDPTLHDKLVKWSVEAGRNLNASGVDAQKNYLDILNNLPPAGPDYVRDLADRYNAVLHDSSYKDYSITPRARGEKLAEQVFEGATRFLLGLTPFAPLSAALDPHTSLSANTRLGIDLASGLLGLVAGGGEAAFAERLAAKEAGAVVKAGSEGHLPEHPATTGDTTVPVPSAPAGQAGQAGVHSAQPTVHAAAQGLSVDAAVAEASQRISGAKASLPDSYAVQPAPDSLKAAMGWKNVLIDDNGQHYISSGGKTYPARFDLDNNTWRVYQPDNAYRPQYPVRLNTQGDWEVHTNVGLKGGMNPGELPAAGAQPARPGAPTLQISTSTGAPASASMLETLIPRTWHSAADDMLSNEEFTHSYHSAFDQLPSDQQHALRNWTYLDVSEDYSTGSEDEDVNYELNQQLRDRTYQSDTAARAESLQTALSKLPRPNGDSRLLRIAEVPGNYARQFRPGDYVTNSPAFMSAASDSEYAQANLADGDYVAAPGDAFALYDIQSESATPFIHRVTTLAPGEHEWLFRPNTIFRVDEIAMATSQDAALTPRIGMHLTEVPINEPTFAKNIYTGEEELVYPQGETPAYTTLQPVSFTPPPR
ncbi:Chromosome segregation ATPase [Caballeronia sordidicola]|uniref:Chromosome segregation ATPase n=2 Tax=Caballeronia sordidicola TaxID=196367 RepID=A0A226XA08_CABSO|nr:Chromosome segregation ATPase [Caballeronia sordidicola]